jgi:6-phosphogluconate dehydrogenase
LFIKKSEFLDRIKIAFDKDKNLKSLLFDEEFSNEVEKRQDSWRDIVCLGIKYKIPIPSLIGFYLINYRFFGIF